MLAEETRMAKATEAEPVGFIDGKGDEEVLNDSLGTVDVADSTGADTEKEAEAAGKGAQRDRSRS